MTFTGWCKDFIAAFLPFSCHVCRENTDFNKVLCPGCHNQLAGTIHAPDEIADTRCDFSVFTLSSYDSFMADIIKIIKYHPSAKLLQSLEKLCVENGSLKSFLKPDDILVPVPMHTERLHQRGFNQADRLARSFATGRGCHYSPALLRVRATRPQADCNEQERLSNLAAAFAIDGQVNYEAFANRRLILVDDVATTGTTLQHCADQLQKFKPAAIIGLVVSHSFRQNVL